MADSVEIQIGQQLGNYRLVRLLRREGIANVYLAEHVFLKTQAALQVLPEHLRQESLEQFLEQARQIARMKQPSLLRVLEFGVEDNKPFLVTDFTPDGSLRERYPRGQRVPEHTIALYVRQLAAALQYIHDQGLVHGRVRPENMLLNTQQRVLLSFSPAIEVSDGATLSNSEEDAAEEVAPMVYMAPEQLSGRAIPASDQYALGVVVYEWLSGEPPFQGSAGEIREQHSFMPPALQRKLPSISSDLQQVVMTALAPDPQQRFASVSAFAHALEQVLQPPQTDPEIIAEPPAPPRQKIGGTAMIVCLAALALLVVSGGLLYSAGLFPFARQAGRSTTPIQLTQTVTARGTRQAAATFTAQTPQQIYTLAMRGKPSFNDPLNDQNKSAWQKQGNGTKNSCTFSNGAYLVSVAGSNYELHCVAGRGSFHNFAYQIQMRTIQGDIGGIVFRSNSDATAYYTFSMQLTGSTRLCLLYLHTPKADTQLKSGSLPEAVQTTNLLTAIAYEDHFYFYLNGSFLMDAQDTTLTVGTVGVSAWNITSSSTELAFQNARVWEL